MMINIFLILKLFKVEPVRILIEALKEILTDGNITIDQNGIKLIAMDSTHSVLIHLKLEAQNFEFFNCNKPITIGLNMLNLFKLIKTMTNSETLTLFIEKNNENQLGIIIHNSEKILKQLIN